MAGGWCAGADRSWAPFPVGDRTDGEIADDLREALSLGGLAIEVACEHGVITLTGTVETRDRKGFAERVAGFVLGVRGVQDRLTVCEPA